MGNCTVGSLDIRHIVNVTLVLNTPTFSSAWGRRLGTGWTLSTIYTVRTGIPYEAVLGTDNALNGFNPAGNNPDPQRPESSASNTARCIAGSPAPPPPALVISIRLRSRCRPPAHMEIWAWDPDGTGLLGMGPDRLKAISHPGRTTLGVPRGSLQPHQLRASSHAQRDVGGHIRHHYYRPIDNRFHVGNGVGWANRAAGHKVRILRQRSR